MEKEMKKTPENYVKREIKDYLDVTGWFHFPLTQGLGSYPGLPDRIAVKDGRVLFIECKASGKDLTENQEKFQRDLIEKGGRYVKVYGYKDLERFLAGME